LPATADVFSIAPKPGIVALVAAMPAFARDRHTPMNTLTLVRCATAFAIGCATSLALAAADDPALARGRYITRTGGCNDCHTPGYAETAGAVPESQWLVGAPVGFKGPWGVSYPSNLRLIVQTMTEDAWLPYARSPRRPPMPWFNLRDMSDADLRDVYRYIRSLGPAGTPAPAFAPPGTDVRTPWILFVPQNLPPGAAPAK
jgi:mono/diheme cytochrome c family protein